MSLFQYSRRLSVFLLQVFILGVFIIFPKVALAALYTPGQTLNPACLPTDPNCTVSAAAASGANSDITSLSALTSLTSTNISATAFLSALNATITGITITNSTTTNATSTNSFSNNAVVGSLSASYLTVGSVTGILQGLNGVVSAVSTSSLGLLGSSTVSSIITNYVPKWNGSVFGNSLIYDNGTNVGIGTTSPSVALSVVGQIAATDVVGTRSNLGLAYSTTTDYQVNDIAFWGDSLTNNMINSFWPQIYLPNFGIYNGGVGGDTSTQIATRMLADPAKNNFTTVIWAGRNNYSNVSTVESDITNMVNALGTNRFLILTVLNGPGEPYGGSNYNNIISINNWIAATYPNNYYDIRSYLVSQYNPSIPQDVTDHGNDVVPSSLRVDSIHLTNYGYNLVMQKVSPIIKSMVSSSQDKVVSYKSLGSIFSNPFPMSQVTIESTTTNNSAWLDPEMTSSSGWSFGGDWSGNYSTGFIHTAGSASTLTEAITPNAGYQYQIVFTISGSSAGSVSVYLGDGFGQSFSGNSTYSTGPSVVDTNGLTFIPTTNFTGTISNISVKFIARSSLASLSVLDAVGSTTLEIRAPSASLGDTFVGLGVGGMNTTGTNNTGFGVSVLPYNTTGSSNTASGYKSMYANTLGSGNTALGWASLYSATSSSNNVAIGDQALWANVANGSANNVAVGNNSLQNNTYGTQNTALGGATLFNNTIGSLNLALGYDSLYTNTIGSNNIALGYGALYTATSSSNNIAIGNSALQASVANGTSNNIAIGASSLGNNTYGTQNNALGGTTLRNNTTGSNNNAFGTSALYNNTTGSSNIGIGWAAMYGNTTGGNNTAVGSFALWNGTSSIDNTAVGAYALYNNAATAGYNSAFGDGALTNNTYGNYNTAMGYYSLSANTTGSDNDSFGLQSLSRLTTGSNNVAFGDYAGVGSLPDQRSVIDSNSLFLGYYASRDPGVASTTALSYATAIGSSAMIKCSYCTAIGGTGNYAVNVGIGTTSPFARLSINGVNNDSNPLFVLATTTGTATSTVFQISSNGLLTMNTPGATSTINGNLYVNGTIRGTNVYNGDLVFANNFRFTEAPATVTPQSLFLENQNGKPIFNIDENGNLNIFGNITSTSPSFIQGITNDVVNVLKSVGNLFVDTITAVSGVFTNVQSDSVQTDTLCIGHTCVTESQLQTLLQNAKIAPLANLPVISDSSSTLASDTPGAVPPVISVNGNNPARVPLGSTYSDLGATITGPSADLNLGIKTLGMVDTTTLGTYSMNYIVTDQSGLTSTSTRTVIVYDPNTGMAGTSTILNMDTGSTTNIDDNVNTANN